MSKQEYIQKMTAKINEQCVKVDREKVITSINEFKQFIDLNEQFFTKQEKKYILEDLKHEQITVMRGLVKDHKTPMDIRLINPENDSYFTGFKKVMAKSLRKLMSSNGLPT